MPDTDFVIPQEIVEQDLMVARTGISCDVFFHRI